jgi:hypothetical protein
VIDDEIGVLDHLPRRFDGDGQDEPRGEGERQKARNEPEPPVEQKAVNQVGGRVPVDQVLGVLRAHDVEMPELEIAAFADERMAHQVEGEPRSGDDGADNKRGLGWGELHGGASVHEPPAVVILAHCDRHRLVMTGLVPAIHAFYG